MIATEEMLDPSTASDVAARIGADLLAYCSQDTMSMVMIYQTVQKAAS